MYKLNELPDYEGLLKQALDKIPDNYDKREGSVIFNAVAPMCMELAYLYLKLRTMTDLIFIDTSVGQYLDRLVLQNGIQRLDSTYAEKYGTFNVDGLEGSYFIKDDVQFEVISLVDHPNSETFIYRLRCVQRGTIGNVENGPLTSLNYINGLKVAEITGTIKEGSDVETDEHLRQRYIDNVTDIAYGGNKSDYRQKVKSLDGVGSCKVIPVWNGPGTVKCIITNADYTTPSETLISQVQETIDPTQNGHGVGIAPIGHIVTIVGATSEEINIEAQIATQHVPVDLQNKIEEAVKNYIKVLNQNWESVDNVVVRVSQITNILLDVEGIIDVGDIKINGKNQNYTLQSEKLAEFGSVTTSAL